MSGARPPTHDDVLAASVRVAGMVQRTPVVLAEGATRGLGAEVHLKLESLQPTGSFKVRGAANRLLLMPEEERRRGVVTVSTGNHGRAVAYVAGRLGAPVTVCLSELVPSNKVAALRATGAELIIGGAGQDEAEERATELTRERGLTLVHPFDDPHVIAGQGTLALELLEQLPDMDTVLVPLSGGGLVSGVALALKALRPSVRVVAVSAAATPVMLRSVVAGRPVALPEVPTLADSLGGGIGLHNRYTLKLVTELVDEHVEVSERDIGRAMVELFVDERLVVEGASAVGMAALASGRVEPGRSTAVIVSGRNVDVMTLIQLVGGAGEES